MDTTMEEIDLEMEVHFLGTGGTYPSKYRYPSAVAVKRGGRVVLLDCGEGTQRQFMKQKGLSYNRVEAIFISHFHGDHYLGLLGLIQTMSINGRAQALNIYGPPGTVKFVRHFLRSGYVGMNFELRIGDMRPGESVEAAGMTVTAVKLDHSVPTNGYVLEEPPRRGVFNREKAEEMGIPPGPLYKKLKAGEDIIHNGMLIKSSDIVGPPRPGRKVFYALDTRPLEKPPEIAKGCDLLIADSTGIEEIAGKIHEYGHSTAKDATTLARKLEARRLALTHISQRYHENPKRVLDEALEYFPDTFLPEDLDMVRVEYRD